MTPPPPPPPPPAPQAGKGDHLRVDKTVDAAISLNFQGMETYARFPYYTWEAGFVRRWGLAPVDSGGARAYLATLKLELGSPITAVVAARAWHLNEFQFEDTPNNWQLLRKMEEDFDRVPPEVHEGRQSSEEQERVLQYNDKLDPQSLRNRGAFIFDMGRRSRDR